MLRYKSTVNLGELQKYFSSSEKAIHTLFKELRSLRIYNKLFQTVDKINTQYGGKQLFTMLLLFPLFAITDISHFSQSSLFQLHKSGKDVFYQFLNCSLFDWRKEVPQKK